MTLKTRALFVMLFLAFMVSAALPSTASTSTVTTTLKVVVDLKDEIRVTRSNVHLDPYEGKEDVRSEFEYHLAVFGPEKRKVTARLEAPLPQGVTLSIELSAPGKGHSTGLRPLSTKPVTLLKDLAEMGACEGIGILNFHAEVTSPTGEGFSRIILEISQE